MPDEQLRQRQKGETQSSGRLDNFLRWASFAVDVLVFVAVALYAVMAYQQWKEMRLDRRAWVSIQSIKGFPEAMKPFRVTLVVSNTGRTFAKHLTIVATGHYCGPDETPNFSAEIKEEAKKVDREMISDALLAPNAAVEATLNQQDKMVAISEKANRAFFCLVGLLTKIFLDISIGSSSAIDCFTIHCRLKTVAGVGVRIRDTMRLARATHLSNDSEHSSGLYAATFLTAT
jgi:hypothetical protein